MDDSNHNHNPDFARALESVYELAQDQKATSPDPWKQITHNGFTYLAVPAMLKENFDPTIFRRQIESILFGKVPASPSSVGYTSPNLPTENGTDTGRKFRIIQVVGDSGSSFEPSYISRIRDVVKKYILGDDGAEGTQREVVIEYGYTASPGDVNWIVNDIISSDPGGLCKRAVANVVYQSAEAVRSGCEASKNVGVFVLAFSRRPEPRTRFGEDVFLSDGILESEHGDAVVCVEGGVQSFLQAAGVLSRGVRVVAVTRRALMGEREKKFSAAGLLRRFRDERLEGKISAGIWTGEAVERRMEEMWPGLAREQRVKIVAAVQGMVDSTHKLGIIEVVVLD